MTWRMRARVRVVADTVAANPYSGDRTYRAGEELEMILVGHEDKPLSAAHWWSGMDIDLAHILDADDVTIVQMLGPTWVTCDGCGKSGEIERTDDGRAHLDVGGRIARQRQEAARKA